MISSSHQSWVTKGVYKNTFWLFSLLTSCILHHLSFFYGPVCQSMVISVKIGLDEMLIKTLYKPIAIAESMKSIALDPLSSMQRFSWMIVLSSFANLFFATRDVECQRHTCIYVLSRRHLFTDLIYGITCASMYATPLQLSISSYQPPRFLLWNPYLHMFKDESCYVRSCTALSKRHNKGGSSP